MEALDYSWIQKGLVSSELLVLQPETASFHHQVPCVGHFPAAWASLSSVLEPAVPSSVDPLRLTSACHLAGLAPSSSSAVAEVVVVGNRHIGQTLAAAAGRPDINPSDCQCSYNLAAVVASTLAAVDIPATTLQLADDMAEVGHHTGQAHTAAVDCMVALNTHTITHSCLTNGKNIRKTSLKSHTFLNKL